MRKLINEPFRLKVQLVPKTGSLQWWNGPIETRVVDGSLWWKQCPNSTTVQSNRYVFEIFTINHQWWQFSVHAPHVLSSRGCHKICIDQAVNTKTSHYSMYYIYIMYTLLTPLTDPIITTSFSYCTLAKFSVCQFRIPYPYVMIGIYHDQNYSGDKYSFMYT